MQLDQKRHEFITLIGGAAAWPFAARAQQAAMPVVVFLDQRSPDDSEDFLRPFRQGLKDTGYVERRGGDYCSLAGRGPPKRFQVSVPLRCPSRRHNPPPT